MKAFRFKKQFLSKLILLWKGKHNFTRSIGISRATLYDRAFERHYISEIHITKVQILYTRRRNSSIRNLNFDGNINVLATDER